MNYKSQVAIGNFDGFHLGHQALIKELMDLKTRKPQHQTIVITFNPHPRLFLNPQFPLINTLEQRQELLHLQKIDNVAFLDFSKLITDNIEPVSKGLVRILRMTRIKLF